MTNTFTKIVAVLGLTALSGMVSGCDQTAAEYQQGQVEQKMALYQSISGNYVGTLTTQGSSCNIQVALNPSVTTSTAGDGTSSQGTAQLQANVTLNCGSFTATQAIPQLYYIEENNSNNGNFAGNFTVSVPGNTQPAATMSISGTINGGQMNGTLQMTSPAGFTGSFTATLNGSPGQSVIGGNTGTVTVQNYQGTYQAPCPDNGAATCNFNFTLQVEELPQEQANFYNYFSETKLVSIQFNTSYQSVLGGNPIEITMNPIGLQSATLDLVNHVLDGEQSGLGPNSGTVSIHCGQLGVNLQCSLIGLSTGTEIKFTAQPGPAAN